MRFLKTAKLRYLVVISITLIALCLGGCQGSRANADNTLKIYCFGDYFDPEIIDEFEEETGINVIVDSFDTNEEMFPVIDKGTVPYDVVCTSDYMISKLMERGKLWPLNKEELTNLKNIDDRYLKLTEAFDPGQKYSVPHTFGTMGIMYDQRKIKGSQLSMWQDLWNKKYEDLMVLPDSMRDLMAIALKKNGYSINSQSKEHIAKAGASLEEQKPLVYKYANDSARDMVLGGAVPFAVVWSGEVLYSREENSNIQYVIPKEGTEAFMDSWVIPQRAMNKGNALKWMNFLMREDIALKNFEYLYFAIPNKAVIKEVSKNPQDEEILFPRDEILSKCEFLKPIPPKVEDLYSKAWKKFKSS